MVKWLIDYVACVSGVVVALCRIVSRGVALFSHCVCGSGNNILWKVREAGNISLYAEGTRLPTMFHFSFIFGLHLVLFSSSSLVLF